MVSLLDSLAARLESLFEGYTLLNKNKVLQNVRVFRQYMPNPEGLSFPSRDNSLANYSETDMESNFPCIIVKFVESTDQEERRIDSSRVQIKLLFACYDDASECQGWRDILNMQFRVRECLLIARSLDDKYRLEMPVKTRLLECETWPVYFGEMDLVYSYGRPAMVKDFVYKRNPRHEHMTV